VALPDFRIALGLKSSGRATRQFPKPRPSNPAAKLGLRYEANVGKQLQRHVTNEHFDRLEHNPWFSFYDTFGYANCCPDFILWYNNRAIVVEVKLTWVEVAIAKLEDLYLPVVALALCVPVAPLVICRNVTRNSPRSYTSLTEALTSSERLLHWPQTGPIAW
jgi:hypothetical protein